MRTRTHCFRRSLSSGWRPATIWDVTTYPAIVPLDVLDQVRPFGITQRMLDYWRSHGWLGRYAQGSGTKFPWDDVMDQVWWLVRLHQAEIIINDSMAKLGIEARLVGAEYVYSVHGDNKQWVAATEEQIERLVNEGVGMTAVRVRG